jgi:hypothetical protein
MYMDNKCFDNRTMLRRRHPLCDINQETYHHENSDDELPPPPPSFYKALIQFMADTSSHFAEAIAQIS